MSPVDPTIRFLGIPGDSDPLTLLGLHPSQCTPSMVEAALVSRLAKVYDHPDGRSAEADEVRDRLRHAADQLKEPEAKQDILQQHAHVLPELPTSSPPVPVRTSPESLTPLQQQLLQVLAGCGGWNAATRTHLASIGVMHGLSSEELVTELQGLNKVVGSGARFAFSPHRSQAPSVDLRALEPGYMERVVHQYAPEFRRSDMRTLVKLSLLFGGIGLLLLLLLLRVLLFSDSDSILNMQSSATPDSRNVTDSFRAGQLSTEDSNVPVASLMPFDSIPLLSLKTLPGEVLDDVDASIETIRMLESLARRVIGMDEINEQFEEEWKQAINVASTGWFATDGATSRSMRKAVSSVIEIAGSNPELVGPLIRMLSPSRPVLTDDPLAMPRGAWRGGMMGMLAATESISPAGRTLANAQFRAAVGRSAKTGSFAQGAASWLAGAIPSLTDGTGIRESAEENWKFWLLSIDALDAPGVTESILLEAMYSLLATNIDLARPGLHQAVLGRILSQLDWQDGNEVMESVFALFDDAAITSSDLWVFTSMMARLDATSWFDRRLVVAPDADLSLRRRIRSRMNDIWPKARIDVSQESMGVPDGFDPHLADTWLALSQKVHSIPLSRGSIPMLQRILMERLLAESASDIMTSGGQGALPVLNELETLLDTVQESDGRQPSSGVDRRSTPPGGRIDGQWARLYEMRGRTSSDKRDMFRELELQSGQDLGPIDADLLASEAMSASLSVREAAQYLIEIRFALGPNVAQALVDRFPTATSTVDVSELIQTITGAQLPRPSSSQWPLESRLALVNHALSLRLHDAGTIDGMAEAIARSFRRETQRLGRVSDPDSNPDGAAQSLVSAWSDRLFPSGHVGTSSWIQAWLDRREARSLLASDALQRCLVEQIALQELLGYWMQKVMPSVATSIAESQENLVLRRDRAVHVLEQMLQTEALVVHLWKIRIQFILRDIEMTGGGA